MYKKFFDCDRQEIMRDYFLNNLSKLGYIRKYKKNELINVEAEGYVAIVTKGVVSQNIISLKGHEKLLYLIRTGEIFGEMIHFCGGVDSIVTRTKETAEISIISGDILEKELKNYPEIYRHFIHSITRKYRILMIQLTTNTFNDSRGRIADTLLRLSSAAEPDLKGRMVISAIYTHEELASNIGCSRITVTRCLNEFLKQAIISYDNKKIVILNPDMLKEYIDIFVEKE